MTGTCSECGATIGLHEFERRIVVEPHRDGEDTFCSGSNEPPVREVENIAD